MGASCGRRLFGNSSGSDSDGSGDSDNGGDDTYRPDPHHLAGRGKGSVLSKRKRHGQLPGAAAAADKVGAGQCRNTAFEQQATTISMCFNAATCCHFPFGGLSV